MALEEVVAQSVVSAKLQEGAQTRQTRDTTLLLQEHLYSSLLVLHTRLPSTASTDISRR